MNNLEKMIAVGKVVYGDQWQSPLSRALGVSDRTIRNFISGRSRIPADLSLRLIVAMNTEMEKIKSAISIIESDKMKGEDIDLDLIKNIASRYNFADKQEYMATIDAINNAVHEVTYLSDLDAIARGRQSK
ncbi:TPA: hypothetical protein R8E83_003567 [Escherichia coli]|nr:hypothetical protein [Escherichia coli]